jgi:hypothetical protein
MPVEITIPGQGFYQAHRVGDTGMESRKRPAGGRSTAVPDEGKLDGVSGGECAECRGAAPRYA